MAVVASVDSGMPGIAARSVSGKGFHSSNAGLHAYRWDYCSTECLDKLRLM